MLGKARRSCKDSPPPFPYVHVCGRMIDFFFVCACFSFTASSSLYTFHSFFPSVCPVPAFVLREIAFKVDRVCLCVLPICVSVNHLPRSLVFCGTSSLARITGVLSLHASFTVILLHPLVRACLFAPSHPPPALLLDLSRPLKRRTHSPPTADNATSSASRPSAAPSQPICVSMATLPYPAAGSLAAARRRVSGELWGLGREAGRSGTTNELHWNTEGQRTLCCVVCVVLCCWD